MKPTADSPPSGSPDPLRGPRNIRLPVHGEQASLLFRESGLDGYRLATTGGKFAVGDRVEVRPGLQVTIRHFLGGGNPLPGEPPRERLWFTTVGDAAVDDHDDAAAEEAALRRRMRDAISVPVRHRNRKLSLAS